MTALEVQSARMLKGRATNAVSRAVASGKLVRPDACSRCGRRGLRGVEAHHESYLPQDFLAVVWLCRACHAMRTKELQREAESLFPDGRVRKYKSNQAQADRARKQAMALRDEVRALGTPAWLGALNG